MLYLIFTNFIVFLSIFLLLKFKKKSLINRFNKNLEPHNYNDNIIPLGGVILITLIFLNYKYFSLEFLISCLLIFLLGLSSDLKIFKSPVARFIMMMFVVGIYIYFSNTIISQNNFPIIYKLMNNKLFNFIFLLVCILIIINGCNFIDGVNNNLNFYFLLFNISILYIKYIHAIDFEINILLIIFTFFFLYLNYKNIIMFGDNGAYLIGFLCALEIVQLTNEIQILSKYFAILLLAYPSYEVLFSIIRRTGRSLLPDEKHLHLLLVRKNNQNHFKTSLQLNSLNLIIFSIGSIFYNDDLIIVFLIFLYLITYNFYHYYLSR